MYSEIGALDRVYSVCIEVVKNAGVGKEVPRTAETSKPAATAAVPATSVPSATLSLMVACACSIVFAIIDAMSGGDGMTDVACEFVGDFLTTPSIIFSDPLMLSLKVAATALVFLGPYVVTRLLMWSQRTLFPDDEELIPFAVSV